MGAEVGEESSEEGCEAMNLDMMMASPELTLPFLE